MSLDFMTMEHFNRCVCCGYWIGRERRRTKYRILYKTENGVKLTGIGTNWDDRIYYGVGGTLKMISVDRYSNDYGYHHGTPIKQTKVSDVHNAFVFHSGCWDELCGCFSREQLNLEALFSACMDSPKVIATIKGHSRRETRFSPDGVPRISASPPAPSIWRIWKAQAVNLRLRVMISSLIHQNESKCKGKCVSLLHLPFALPAPPDTFGRFPVELREEIVSYLSTHDFLALRCASRSMACLFESQRFWRTRFLQTDERPTIAPFFRPHRINSRGPIYWRALYHYTVRNAPAVVRGAYSWTKRQQNIAWLKEKALALGTTDHSPRMREIVAMAANSYSKKVFFVESVLLPDWDVEFAVWVGNSEKTTYIAGIEISAPEHPTIRIGHRLAEKPVRRRVSTLQCVAVGIRNGHYGVTGIAFGEKQQSLQQLTWIGQPGRATYWRTTDQLLVVASDVSTSSQM
ncbi:hypothetical protein BDV59DRAFT_202513 [Aspergillus ambiguus]|uniref:F-box domain protein n=1 Tax=Aspergillus ambiguus TaxID=176160 RepID=UPI003CCE3EEE